LHVPVHDRSPGTQATPAPTWIDALFTSGTSPICVTRLGVATGRPEEFIGMQVRMSFRAAAPSPLVEPGSGR